MSMTSDALHGFNLATMSGVFPGTRSQLFQRVWLVGLADDDRPAHWAQLLWYQDPVSCVLFLQGADGHLVGEPLLRLTEPGANLLAALQNELHALGWRMQTCGTCRFWQGGGTPGESHLPIGRCSLHDDEATPAALVVQSGLAPLCPHWQAGDADIGTHNETESPASILPLRKIAEISESKLPAWRRSWLRLVRCMRPAAATRGWTDLMVERSGVGAGTEPCLACSGRIANLGALAVATPDGDTQTYSIWRCRLCFATYLNDWIDRWVRLDNLETEERYYRLAPVEALALLRLIDAVQGGEHPGRRGERHAQRAQLMEFLADRTPLSHQTKQGR